MDKTTGWLITSSGAWGATMLWTSFAIIDNEPLQAFLGLTAMTLLEALVLMLAISREEASGTGRVTSAAQPLSAPPTEARDVALLTRLADESTLAEEA